MLKVTPLATNTLITYSITFNDGKTFRWVRWRGILVPLVLHSGRLQLVCDLASQRVHHVHMKRILGLDVPHKGRSMDGARTKTMSIYVQERRDKRPLLHFPRWEDVVFAGGPRSAKSQQELTAALKLWKDSKPSTEAAS